MKFIKSIIFSEDRILIILFILINLLVLINAILHNPLIGYDMDAHIINIGKLAQFNWPTSLESSEFFSPPIPYILPSVLVAVGVNIWWAMKMGQLLNVFLSLGTTCYLLKICESIFPGNTRYKVISLGLLGILPVYYKMFSQVRGENFVVFFAVLTAFLTISVFVQKNLGMAQIIKLGLGMGALPLSRQWGIFVLAGIFIFGLIIAVIDTGNRKRIVKAIVLISALTAIIGGAFYAFLFIRYGTLLSFNREPDAKPKPISFYFGTGDGLLFTDPVRPNFSRQALPILYSGMWGDYFSYFSIYMIDRRTNTYMSGRDLETEASEKVISKWADTNRFKFNSYLGRVNLVSILPTFLLFLGALYGPICAFQFLRHPMNNQKAIFCLIFLISIFIVGGFLWFLIRYPMGGPGDTIKTDYVLQLFPFLAMFSAAVIDKIKSKQVMFTLATLLALIAIHNLPAMVSHFIYFPGVIPVRSW